MIDKQTAKQQLLDNGVQPAIADQAASIIAQGHFDRTEAEQAIIAIAQAQMLQINTTNSISGDKIR